MVKFLVLIFSSMLFGTVLFGTTYSTKGGRCQLLPLHKCLFIFYWIMQDDQGGIKTYNEHSSKYIYTYIFVQKFERHHSKLRIKVGEKWSEFYHLRFQVRIWQTLVYSIYLDLHQRTPFVTCLCWAMAPLWVPPTPHAILTDIGPVHI